MGIMDYTVLPDTSIRDAIEKIDRLNKRAIFVVDSRKRLLGLFTEGDMRKYILSDGNLSASITEAMNCSPIVFDSVISAKKLKRSKKWLFIRWYHLGEN